MFVLQHNSVELLLQCFVEVVDAQLLKRVDGKGFEAKNVPDANGGGGTLGGGIGDLTVDALHEVLKESAMNKDSSPVAVCALLNDRVATPSPAVSVQ